MRPTGELRCGRRTNRVAKRNDAGAIGKNDVLRNVRGLDDAIARVETAYSLNSQVVGRRAATQTGSVRQRGCRASSEASPPVTRCQGHDKNRCNNPPATGHKSPPLAPLCTTYEPPTKFPIPECGHLEVRVPAGVLVWSQPGLGHPVLRDPVRQRVGSRRPGSG